MMQHRLVSDIIVRPEYLVGYEQAGDTTFVHVQVRKWTPKVAKQFREDIGAAQCLLNRPVYALDVPENPNLRKFLTLHGFVPCGHVRDVKGRLVEIFERSLDGRHVRRWTEFEHQPASQ